MSISIKRQALLAAVVVLFPLASGSVLADPAATRASGARVSDVPTLRVSYSDLDLSQPSAVKTLKGRVLGAVRTVCGNKADMRQLQQFKAQRDCQQQAWDDAIAQVAGAVREIRVAAR